MKDTAQQHEPICPTCEEDQTFSPKVVNASSRGISLIEILIVLAIIGMIMAGVTVYAGGAFQSAQVDTTRNNIIELERLVEMYKIRKKGACPKAINDLQTAGITKKVPDDAWGTPFELSCPGKHGDMDISSAGPDLKHGTDDDITNWEAAEGGEQS